MPQKTGTPRIYYYDLNGLWLDLNSFKLHLSQKQKKFLA